MSTHPRTMESSSHRYDLDDAVPVDGLTAVPDGTNLLVAGPSVLGPDRIAMDILDCGLRLGEHAVVVTPNLPADRIRSRYTDLLGPDAPALHIVDCCAAGDAGASALDWVTDVASPGNLTDVGVALTRATRATGDDPTVGVRISLLSLTTLLQYTGLDPVFKFVHVATSRFAAAGYLCVGTIDSTAHDARTLNKIKGQFDGVVQLREAPDGDAEIRARGFPDASSAWTPI